MVSGGDVAWVSPSTRLAKNIGVPDDPAVKAIVDAAAAATAPLRNQVIGTATVDILRVPDPAQPSRRWATWSPTRCSSTYPGVEAAITNSGGLRQDIRLVPPSAGEQPGEITWGEVFAVLPFGNRTVIETLTGAQLTTALLNGVSPVCDATIATGRFPQVAGLRITYACTDTDTRRSPGCGRSRRTARRRRSARPTRSAS